MADVGFDDFDRKDSGKTSSFYDNKGYDQLVHCKDKRNVRP